LIPNSSAETLERIHTALEAAREVLTRFTAGDIEAKFKVGDDPVTAADRSVDDVLRKTLLRPGEGWLSEETVDDFTRLDKTRVWVVDPLDGTREFVQGIPEYCVSIAMVENNVPVAGGICNPATNELIMGSRDTGVTYNGKPAQPSQRKDLHGALVLASRSEVKRGEWKQFESAEFNIRPMGSVAYKLGLVAAGLADLTFTLVPKNEWDVAAGAALVEAAGGWTLKLDHTPLRCNQKNPLITGLLAGGPFLRDPLLLMLNQHSQTIGADKQP
jgi:myo-inositol-1(or 4)-monophosphatase